MEYELQQVIGTDKKNPDFNVIKDTNASKLYIYIGSVLYSAIEIYSDNRKNALLKIEIAKLFIAGLNQRVLKESFGFAISTMRRWSEALLTGNIEIITAAISGPGAPQKVNSEIKRFVEVRFIEIYKTNKYSYSKIIRNEIETIYQITISSETLRPIFNKLKKHHGHNSSANLVVETFSDRASEENEKGVITCDLSDAAITAEPVENAEDKENKDISTDMDNVDNRNNLLDFKHDDEGKNHVFQGYGHHVGILLFLPYIAQIVESFQIGKEFLRQWIIFLLLGVPNIERSKHIDFNALEAVFSNSMVHGLRQQRIILGNLHRRLQ